jgi:tryptophanyl-tRNA synthetase
LNKALQPFREKRALLAADPNFVTGVLHDGAERARAIARQTMAEVREAVQLPR